MADSDKKDTLILGPEVSKGTHIYVREEANGEISSGLVSTEPEGLPHHDSLLSLTHRGGPVYEIDEEFHMTAQGGSDGGKPPKIASRQYRAGWDRIFGKKPVVGSA